MKKNIALIISLSFLLPLICMSIMPQVQAFDNSEVTPVSCHTQENEGKSDKQNEEEVCKMCKVSDAIFAKQINIVQKNSGNSDYILLAHAWNFIQIELIASAFYINPPPEINLLTDTFHKQHSTTVILA